MLRMMAAWLVRRANCGKCSLIWMPLVAVWIWRNGPPWSVPGRRSKVSLWLGPPAIHRRMQFLVCWRGFLALTARKVKPLVAGAPTKPAAGDGRSLGPLVDSVAMGMLLEIHIPPSF